MSNVKSEVRQQPVLKQPNGNSFIEYQLKGLCEVLKELDKGISERKFKKKSYGTVFSVNTGSKKLFYFEEDNRDVRFSYCLEPRKSSKDNAVNVYCTFRLEDSYKFKEFDDVGKSIGEKYVDTYRKYVPRFKEIAEEGKEMFKLIKEPEANDYYIYIYANFDTKTAILRVGDSRKTIDLE